MLTIQLNPQLHSAVHMMKKVELRKGASSILASLSLSKEESSAVVKSFNREKQQSEPKCNWY